MQTFKAQMDAAVEGGPWIEIAAGTFQPGAAAPLDLRGEAYPGVVCDDFVAEVTNPEDAGSWETLVGSVRYRINWAA